jgi:phospho-N-acetylmuramoyl-pentapeptide-transferase
MAAMTALVIGLAAGPAVIRRLTALKIGQPCARLRHRKPT